ncbi:unnamed protein product [Peniophora sp. CBMAI 1063]|nr:unnamed protein product [Peniophora sp. CBMAI 1063]
MGQTASSQAASASLASSSTSPAKCPVDHTAMKPANPAPAKCPVDHASMPTPPAAASAPAKCPVDHNSVDARNNMPTLSQMPTTSQESLLPTERETSSIPRDDGERWEYPSPQQFHNALARKGMETPEEHVEMMVQIHNFLNERAWDEVCKWEEDNGVPKNGLQLVKFKGRPGELSPKARFQQLAAWLLPERFSSEPPFDRHDWIVRRPGSTEDVRYVIDYYSAPPLPDGSPVFSLDVRPALDSPWSVSARAKRAWQEWTAAEEAAAHAH